MKRHLLVISLLIIFSLIILFPLFREGFFVTDDGEWMIIRLSAFHQALKDGEFPVRVLGRLNHEYGYPVSTFLYPGFLYLAEPIHILGLNFVASIKALLGLSLFLSGVFTYFWLRRFFDTFSASIGAVCYLFLPYHLYDLYIRGSVGEMLALAVVPFILWQIERKSIFWVAVGLGVLILSHNTLAALFMPLIIAYMTLSVMLKKQRRETVYRYTAMLVLGLGLASFFWIPALYELQYTVFSKTTVANWKEYFSPVSLLGYPVFFVLLITIINGIWKKIILRKHRLTILLFFFSIISLFLASSLSEPVWRLLPVDFVQFPFRFLSSTLLGVAFLIACNLSVLHGYKRALLSVAFIGILIFSAIPYARPSEFFNKEEGYYLTNMATTTVHDEYLPIWVTEKPTTRPERKVIITKGKGEISSILATNKHISFTTQLEQASTVQIQTVYWPGWNASIDGKSVPILYNNPKGLMELAIPEGRRVVAVSFGETPLRLVSDAISVLSLLALIFLSILASRSKIKR